MIQNIDQALRIIKSTMFHHKNSSYFPYFFIVGAGISVPEIPSASRIVEICKKTVQEIDDTLFKQYDEESKAFVDNGMKYYSSWIEYAYPNRINRSQLFKDLCSKAKISSANLMLAQILNSGEFANTVFTTNFDDSIRKALDLIGAKNYFCAENVMDNLVISNQTKDIQIVHVHGTFNFYDCANLENEIDNIASQSGTVSSARLLSSFLANQAPIIVGYSGWENDVIMQCLKERLTYPTPLQYIWICYDKKSYLALPEWIKKSDSVIFVIPDSDKGNCEDGCDTNSWENTVSADTIDAAVLFKRIISDNKLKPPIIFTDPYQYYFKKIKDILPENEDVLHLRHWTQRLRLLESDDAFERLVQKLEAVYISKDYEQASDIVLEMSSLQLNEANAEFVCTYLIRDFIRDEDVVSSFEQRLKFHLSSLQFLEGNMHQLSNTKNLVSTMRSMLFTRCRYADKEKMLELFEKVIKLAQSDDRLLLVELTAMATKSDFVDKDYRTALLREVISRCPDVKKNKSFAYLKYKALCELGETIQSSESIDLIKEAEQIIPILTDDTLKVSICAKKAKLLSYVSDPDTKDVWMKDIFDALTNPIETIGADEYIELASYLTFVKTDLIKAYSVEYNIEYALIELVGSFLVDVSKCHSILQYSQCCEVICSLSDDPAIIEEFGQKVFKVSSLFPHVCKSFLSTIFFVARMYMMLPENVANDSQKTRVLQGIKENEHTHCLYFDILDEVVYAKLISDCSILSADIEYVNNLREKVNCGYKLYCEGKHQEAERLFNEALNCDVPSVADSVLTNLGYMARRKEVVSDFVFEELMQRKKNQTGFDFMNLLLYYSSRNEFENEEYQRAKSKLKEISEDEKNSIIEWWSNINLVGEEESKLALSFFEDA